MTVSNMDPQKQSEGALRRSKARMLQTFKPREKLFLIFADLDGTFTPMTIAGKIDFVNVVKELMEREKCHVKFVPVSGRPSGYVLRILHETRDMLAEFDVRDVCDYGAAEQGALIVDASRSYGPEFTGDPAGVGLKAAVGEILAASPHRRIVSDEPDKIYTCSIHIKNEDKAAMSHDEQFAIYNDIKTDVVRRFGERALNIAMSHNCMEVMSKEISKGAAIQLLMRRYAHDYDVVGLLYAGDAENDRVAMEFVSKLAEIPGINAHNFIPGNAQEAIHSEKIEQWKYANRAAHEHYVEKSVEQLFKGITQLIRRAINEHRLVGTGVQLWHTRDDSCPTHLADLREAHALFRHMCTSGSTSSGNLLSPRRMVVTPRHVSHHNLYF